MGIMGQVYFYITELVKEKWKLLRHVNALYKNIICSIYYFVCVQKFQVYMKYRVFHVGLSWA